MKKIIYAILIGASVYSLTSCKKPVDETPTTVSGTKADDASARNELDKAYSDIEAVFNSQQYADASGLRTTGAILPCGKVTFDTKNFTIDYSKSGINCGSRVLSGSIDVTLETSGTFADVNAKLKIVYHDYKILYYTNNQSITYNGTEYVTNTSGGSFIELFGKQSSVVYKVRGQLDLTFDSTGTGTKNVTRRWNIFREKTYTSDGTETGIALSFKGDTSIPMDTYMPGGDYNMVSEYGISRDGDKFVCEIPTAFNWSNCGSSYAGPYILKDGKVQYTVDLSTNLGAKVLGITKGTWSATAGYRYDTPNSYPYDGSCDSDGYKLEFTLKNSSGTNVYSTTSFQAY